MIYFLTNFIFISYMRYFTRSGYLNPDLGSQQYLGYHSSYWANIANMNNGSSYHLFFHSSAVYLADRDQRWFGLSTRCLAI